MQFDPNAKYSYSTVKGPGTISFVRGSLNVLGVGTKFTSISNTGQWALGVVSQNQNSNAWLIDHIIDDTHFTLINNELNIPGNTESGLQYVVEEVFTLEPGVHDSLYGQGLEDGRITKISIVDNLSIHLNSLLPPDKKININAQSTVVYGGSPLDIVMFDEDLYPWNFAPATFNVISFYNGQISQQQQSYDYLSSYANYTSNLDTAGFFTCGGNKFCNDGPGLFKITAPASSTVIDYGAHRSAAFGQNNQEVDRPPFFYVDEINLLLYVFSPGGWGVYEYWNFGNPIITVIPLARTQLNPSIQDGRGLCWNNTGSPTISNSYSKDGSGTGVFQSLITGLLGDVNFFRSYAKTPTSVVYSPEQVEVKGLSIIIRLLKYTPNFIVLNDLLLNIYNSIAIVTSDLKALISGMPKTEIESIYAAQKTCNDWKLFYSGKETLSQLIVYFAAVFTTHKNRGTTAAILTDVGNLTNCTPTKTQYGPDQCGWISDVTSPGFSPDLSEYGDQNNDATFSNCDNLLLLSYVNNGYRSAKDVTKIIRREFVPLEMNLTQISS